MTGRSVSSWNGGVRAGVLFIAVALILVWAAPTEAAKKSRKASPDPGQIAAEVQLALEKRINDFESAASKVVADAEKRLDRAVMRVSLREVLTADKSAARSMDRMLRAFQRATERDATRALKTLDKVTTDPDHALAVRMATAEALAQAQAGQNDLRSGIADRVNEAIDTIQMLLDADVVNMVP